MPGKSLELGETIECIGAVGGDRFHIDGILDTGCFSVVYNAHDAHQNQYAIKTEKLNPIQLLSVEANLLIQFQASKHAPTFYGCGIQRKVLWLAMEELGTSILDLRRMNGNRHMNIELGMHLLREGLSAIRSFHSLTGFTHRDIKPNNLLMGKRNPTDLYLIDYGLARRYVMPDGINIRPKRPDGTVPFRGSFRYASANAHRHNDLAFHDDLIRFDPHGNVKKLCLLYTMIDMMKRENLKWRSAGGSVDNIGRIKVRTTPQQLCTGLPIPLQKFTEHLTQLKYGSRPDYDYLQKMIENA